MKIREILNKKNFKNKKIPSGTIYIGRGSKWGNPYSHLEESSAKFKTKNREESIEKYREYLLGNKELMDSISELDDKNLLCYCYPKSCHGDVLKEILEKIED